MHIKQYLQDIRRVFTLVTVERYYMYENVISVTFRLLSFRWVPQDHLNSQIAHNMHMQ